MHGLSNIVSKYPGEKAYTESCYDDYNKISTIITTSIDGRTLRTQAHIVMRQVLLYVVRSS